MKFTIVLSLIFLCLSTTASAEDWKGRPNESQFSLGGLTGLGIIDGIAGYAVLGTASKTILPQGFVPDINNSVSLEGALGAIFLPSATGTTPSGASLAYSAHLRWDFDKDPVWTYYALGGVGGSMTSSTLGGNRFELLPRFGIGAFWKFNSLIYMRGEISHDLVAVGVNFPM